ncbi:MAG: hypothetical protein QM743_06885 [Chitinophagaceae bacterium]
MSKLRNIIPDQETGSKTGARARMRCVNEHAAAQLYRLAAKRLLSVNNWGRISGTDEDSFQLTGSKGEPIDTAAPEPGQLIRIKLPALGNGSGGGYDWVRIEAIEAEGNELTPIESIAIRVRPVSAPVNKEPHTAHFYTTEATSTFCVLRRRKDVWAMEFGRNEVANTHVPLLTALRNLAIAIGAWIGFAHVRWKSLMKGLLRTG